MYRVARPKDAVMMLHRKLETRPRGKMEKHEEKPEIEQWLEARLDGRDAFDFQMGGRYLRTVSETSCIKRKLLKWIQSGHNCLIITSNRYARYNIGIKCGINVAFDI